MDTSVSACPLFGMSSCIYELNSGLYLAQNTGYYSSMRRLSEKLLAVLLSMLLLWPSLPMAGASLVTGQVMDMPSVSLSSADAGVAMDHAAMDCDRCDRAGGCDGGCANGHCASCALAVVPPMAFLQPPVLRLGRFFSNEGIAVRLSSSLFRPPRA